MLSGQLCNLSGTFVKRAQRQIHRDLVDNVAPEELREVGITAHDPKSGLPELLHTRPVIIHKTEKPVAAVWHGCNPSGELNRPGIRAEHQNVMQIVAPFSDRA